MPGPRPTPPVEVTVMTGIAGSGKTAYARSRLPGHAHAPMVTKIERPAEGGVWLLHCPACCTR